MSTERTPTVNAALAAAVRLHDFIRSNCGENAEWPLQITSTQPCVLEKLDNLLREFRTEMQKVPPTSLNDDLPALETYRKVWDRLPKQTREEHLQAMRCWSPRDYENIITDLKARGNEQTL